MVKFCIFSNARWRLGFIFGRSGFSDVRGLDIRGSFSDVRGFLDIRGLDIRGSFSDVRGFRTFGVQVFSVQFLDLWCFRTFGVRTFGVRTFGVRTFGVFFTIFGYWYEPRTPNPERLKTDVRGSTPNVQTPNVQPRTSKPRTSKTRMSISHLKSYILPHIVVYDEIYLQIDAKAVQKEKDPHHPRKNP